VSLRQIERDQRLRSGEQCKRNRRSAIRRLIPAPLLHTVRWLRAHLTPQGRVLHWLERNHADELLQVSPMTRRDRHPELFGFARDRLAQVREPRILSYGCSTGEEAFTLASYLPSARIDAIDINPRNIAIARRARSGAQTAAVSFACAGAPPQAIELYDAIFCLSVLRHGRLEIERLASCAEVLPFARFAETIAALDQALKPGGLLFLWGCNFRFSDTPQAASYRAVAVPLKRAETGLFYGPDNALLSITSNADFVFEKLGTQSSVD